jgi:hypothetical protein
VLVDMHCHTSISFPPSSALKVSPSLFDAVHSYEIGKGEGGYGRTYSRESSRARGIIQTRSSKSAPLITAACSRGVAEWRGGGLEGFHGAEGFPVVLKLGLSARGGGVGASLLVGRPTHVRAPYTAKYTCTKRGGSAARGGFLPQRRFSSSNPPPRGHGPS